MDGRDELGGDGAGSALGRGIERVGSRHVVAVNWRGPDAFFVRKPRSSEAHGPQDNVLALLRSVEVRKGGWTQQSASSSVAIRREIQRWAGRRGGGDGMKDTPWVGIATTRGGVRVLNQRGRSQAVQVNQVLRDLCGGREASYWLELQKRTLAAMGAGCGFPAGRREAVQERAEAQRKLCLLCIGR